MQSPNSNCKAKNMKISLIIISYEFKKDERTCNEIALLVCNSLLISNFWPITPTNRGYSICTIISDEENVSIFCIILITNNMSSITFFCFDVSNYFLIIHYTPKLYLHIETIQGQLQLCMFNDTSYHMSDEVSPLT